MTEATGRTLPPSLIADEARLLQHLPARAPGRDAEIAAEVSRLNDAVYAAAAALDFDDQPGDFLAKLVELRSPDPVAPAAPGAAPAPAPPASPDDRLAWTLLEAAAALRAGRVSSVELTRACLERAAAINPALDCFLRIEADDALAAAREADVEIAAGRWRGPLHGVPLAHKDMFYRNGKPCTGGSLIRRDFIATFDSAVARRLQAAGAIWIGSLNMSEFAANPAGHNVHFGHCRNPWDRDSITGGSSSGSAASVAARACFGSVGSDTGGSVRLPAGLCGVVGLKPTYGRVSRHGALPRVWSLDTVGPLTRTVEDSAAMMSVLAGRDPLDPTTADLPVPDYAALLGGGIRGLRLGLPRAFYLEGLDPSVRARLDEALSMLRDLGAVTVEVELPDQQHLFTISDAVAKVEAATMHGRWMRERPGDYSLFMRSRIESGFHVPGTRYLEGLALRGRLLQQFVEAAFTDADLLFMPVLPIQVPKIAATEVGSPADVQRVIVQLTCCTRNMNFLGLPGLAVPCGFTANGMPASFQLVGRPFSEATLLRAGHAYQQRTHWHRQAPSVDTSMAAR
jgi:aspartyl-tRNA(Asn)/glutamyl-tRNA(Gln) amidotransferase subunit A